MSLLLMIGFGLSVAGPARSQEAVSDSSATGERPESPRARKKPFYASPNVPVGSWEYPILDYWISAGRAGLPTVVKMSHPVNSRAYRSFHDDDGSRVAVTPTLATSSCSIPRDQPGRTRATDGIRGVTQAIDRPEPPGIKGFHGRFVGRKSQRTGSGGRIADRLMYRD